MEFAVEFSNKHDFDFGTYFQSKLVNKSSDDTLGLETKQTYYLWGNKKLQGTVEIDIDKYIIKEEEVEIDGKVMTLKKIVGLK